MNTIEIVTYMYSRSKKQSVPMYIDGEREHQVVANYFHSFMTSLDVKIMRLLNIKVVSVDNLGEFARRSTFSNGLVLNYSISDIPSEFKEEDEWRAPDSFERKEWFVHHVDVNGKSFDHWCSASKYIRDMLEEEISNTENIQND